MIRWKRTAARHHSSVGGRWEIKPAPWQGGGYLLCDGTKPCLAAQMQCATIKQAKEKAEITEWRERCAAAGL